MKVSAGRSHSCSLDIGGAIHCWGKDDCNQSSPIVGDFIQVSAGGYHSCGIDINGGIQCLGIEDGVC